MLSWIVRRRRLVMTLFAALAAAASTGLPRLEVDNSPEAFFLQDARALARYRSFAHTFSNFGALRVALAGPAIWTAEGLAWQARLEDAIQPLEGVVAAAGLPARSRSLVASWPPADVEAFRRETLADELVRGSGLVAADGTAVSIMIALGDLSVAGRRRLLEDLEELLVGAPPGIEGVVGGLPVVNRALDRSFFEVASRFFPLLALLTAGGLALLFRSPAEAARPLALVAFCELGVFGAMGWAGAALDVVTLILAPLLLVLTLATAVHVLLRFRALAAAEPSPEAALFETYRDKGWPVLWTGITTMVGFGSLAISPVPPVRALGLWAAFGIGLMTLAVFTLYPALLAGTARRPRGAPLPGVSRFEAALQHLGRRVGTAVVGRRRRVIAGFALAALPLAWGVRFLETDTGVISYFRPEHPLRAQIERFESRRMAVASAELVIERRSGTFTEAGELETLGRLVERLRREPLIFGVVSATDLPSVEPPPADRFHRATRGMLLEREGRSTRLSLLVPLLGFDELGPLFDRAVATASDLFPESEVWISGRYPLVLAAQRTLLRTLLVSLSLTVACVAALFVAVLGSARLAALALVPNLWPVLAAVSAMGWIGIPLDSTTVMIASVVLGLAVDDTLHYLGSFRRARASESPEAAAVTALERNAAAHTLTSLILAGGFAACALSDFVPVARFGALCAAAILMALAADLLLVPALLGHRTEPAPAGV